jgi:hypothetical protein
MSDAAWKAHRDALDQRNAAAKKAAQTGMTATQLAAVERERRMLRIEEAQMRVLNERIDARKG